jgi:release factor glutamine methyltransferase
MDTNPEMISIGAALAGGASRLAGITDTPDLDSQVLLAALINKPRAWLLAHQEIPLELGIAVKWQDALRRVKKGEPLPYVLGRWEFFNLEFEVSPEVLIPRPETELLVERAICWLQSRGKNGREIRVLDVGTGSGCIAIALAANVPDLQVVAVDISSAALALAQRNALHLLPTTPITFIVSDLFSTLDEKDTANQEVGYKHTGFDLITANLPYIPDGLLKNLPVSAHEPILALAGGEDGLAVIRRFLADAPGHLVEDGLLLLEIESSQGEAMKAMAEDSFPGAEVQLFQDLAGRDRMVEIHLHPGRASI